MAQGVSSLVCNSTNGPFPVDDDDDPSPLPFPPLLPVVVAAAADGGLAGVVLFSPSPSRGLLSTLSSTSTPTVASTSTPVVATSSISHRRHSLTSTYGATEGSGKESNRQICLGSGTPYMPKTLSVSSKNASSSSLGGEGGIGQGLVGVKRGLKGVGAW